MSRRLIPFIALVALTFGLGLAGCKSSEEKACANMVELGKKLGEEMNYDECVTEFKERKEDCKNGDEVLECIADVEGEDEEAIGKAIDECIGKCEKK